jgi:hypothetical protein
MEYITREKLPDIDIPTDLAVCPICGRHLIIEDIDEWEIEPPNEGRVTEGGFHITCHTQPDIDDTDDDYFHEWFNWHYSMPYVDWLPVEVRVYRWFDRRYRIVDEFQSKTWLYFARRHFSLGIRGLANGTQHFSYSIFLGGLRNILAAIRCVWCSII